MDTEVLEALEREATDANTPSTRLFAIYEAITYPDDVSLVTVTDKATRAGVWCALAGNPHLPPELLSPLALLCPRAVAANLALATAYSDKATRNLMREDAILALLGVDSLPTWMVESFLTSRNAIIKDAARSHIALTGERGATWRKELHHRLLEEWTTRVNGKKSPLRKELDATLQLLRVSGIEWLLTPLEEVLAVCESAKLRSDVADSPRIKPLVEKMRQAGSSRLLNTFAPAPPVQSPEKLRQLAARGTWPEHLVAHHPQVPPNLWHRMAVHATGPRTDISMLLALAGNPNASAEMLEQWSQSQNRSLRAMVAKHRHTPPANLAFLAQDREPKVRLQVARHTQASSLILAALAQDVDPRVRGAVGRNALCPPEVLAQLASDENAFVRLDVARHPQTPPYVLAFLAEDEDADILGVLAQRTDLTPAAHQTVATHRVTAQGRGLSRTDVQRAKDRHATAEDLTNLADSPSPQVRALVARHAHTPEEIIALLAVEPDVALALAYDTALPARVTKILMRHMDTRVRDVLAVHPEIDFHPLLQICEDALVAIGAALQIKTERWNEYSKLLSRLVAADMVLGDVARFIRVARNRAQTKNLALYWNKALLPSIRRLFAQPPVTKLDLFFSHPTAASYARYLERMAPKGQNILMEDALQRFDAGYKAPNIESMLLSSDMMTRAIALSHPAIPAGQLEPLNFLPEPRWLWRLSTAMNPSAPRSLLEALADDGNYVVRAAARERLGSL